MRRGVSSVVATVLIIVVVVIGAAIFLSVYLRSVRDIANRDLPLCAGIDLKVTTCAVFPGTMIIPNIGSPLGYNVIYFVVERLPGGEEIGDLRFKVTDTSGKSHVEIPVNITVPGYRILTDYQYFAEHSTKEAVVKPDFLDYTVNTVITPPDYAAVSAVVGNSNTICPPTNEPVKCDIYPPPAP